MEKACAIGGNGLVRLFFSEELQDVAAAKRLCNQCPARTECLTQALERHEPHGVWGGHLFLNGKILRKALTDGKIAC